MSRLLTKDLARLAEVRDAIRSLQEEEKALKEKIQSGLEVGETVERGPFKVSLIEVQGSPDYKSAFIDLAGEDAVKDLPRSTYARLNFSVTGKL